MLIVKLVTIKQAMTHLYMGDTENSKDPHCNNICY